MKSYGPCSNNKKLIVSHFSNNNMPNIDLVVGNFSPYYNVNNLAQTHRKNLKHKPQSFPEKKAKQRSDRKRDRESVSIYFKAM